MKKRIFILAMAILSTSAFAQPLIGTIDGDITGSAEAGNIATTTIGFTGKTIAPITITSSNDSVNFGTVIIGKISTAIVELTPGGEEGARVQLAVSPIDAKEKVTVTLGKEGLGVVGTKLSMTLIYHPTESGHSITEGTSVTVTATYID
ncbi:MAG: hypothetical protein ACRC6U_03160 [Fusobacteriaceae bacterium]